MKTPADYQRPVRTGKTIMGDLLDGAGYILGHRGISTLLILMLIGDAMGQGLYQMLAAYADKIFSRGVDGLSSLMAAAGIGATLSALWLAYGGGARIQPQRVLWAYLGYCAAVICVAVASNFAVAIAAMIGFGMAGELRRTGTISLLQLSIAEAQRGRVMATQFLLQRLAAGIGTYVIGAAASIIGLRLPLIGMAAVCLIAWAMTFRKRQIIASAFEVSDISAEPHAS